MLYGQLLDKLLANPASIVLNTLDIALATFFIYRLLVLIRGSRGELFVKGFIGIMVFLLAARYFELKAIYWLVSVVVIIFIIGIPIVFQAEIRRVLEYIGRGGMFRNTEDLSEFQESSQVIEAVCAAADRLARSSTGALIVLLRHQKPGSEVRGGIELDAEVSSALLESLFYPGSALHDGAVLIGQGRIQRAGCVLPLSDSPDLAVQIGTRHRAALGLSERIDAVVLVVSEESGKISLARAGQLQKLQDVLAIRDILENELIPSETEYELPYWKRFLFGPVGKSGESLVLKLLALMIAIIVWSLASII